MHVHANRLCHDSPIPPHIHHRRIPDLLNLVCCENPPGLPCLFPDISRGWSSTRPPSLLSFLQIEPQDQRAPLEATGLVFVAHFAAEEGVGVASHRFNVPLRRRNFWPPMCATVSPWIDGSFTTSWLSHSTSHLLENDIPVDGDRNISAFRIHNGVLVRRPSMSSLNSVA